MLLLLLFVASKKARGCVTRLGKDCICCSNILRMRCCDGQPFILLPFLLIMSCVKPYHRVGRQEGNQILYRYLLSYTTGDG